jgi:hypothetical protein
MGVTVVTKVASSFVDSSASETGSATRALAVFTPETPAAATDPRTSTNSFRFLSGLLLLPNTA